MRLRKRKKKMTAGNRAPISVLKDSSPFHARHTDTSEAADTLHERGTARKILLTEPPPRLAASPQEVTTNTPLSKAEQPLSTTFPPPTSRSSRLRYQGAWGGSPANPPP